MPIHPGDFLVFFPVFVIKLTDGKVQGQSYGEINALSLFTDEAAAAEFMEPGLTLRQFPNERKLLEYLRGLTGNITHVVVDPMKGKLAGFVALERFIEIVAAGKVV